MIMFSLYTALLISDRSQSTLQMSITIFVLKPLWAVVTSAAVVPLPVKFSHVLLPQSHLLSTKREDNWSHSLRF